MIIDKKKFFIGLVMIIAFSIILSVLMSPIMNGKTVIQTADDLFNSLTKGSTYHIPKLTSSAGQFEGTTYEVSVDLKKPEEVAGITKVFGMAGATVEAVGETKVKISGDLGKTAKTALSDADALFKNNTGIVTEKYGIKGKDVIYYWWTGFSALENKYKKDSKSTEMTFTGTVKGKALEVAYNFEGIQAENIADKAGLTTFMLVFYVIYTLWYGFAIMYIFEGLGIIASAHGEKAEA